MRKIITFGLFVLGCYLFQSTWLVLFHTGNCAPDMMLILVISMAFMRGRRSGMVFGMICGILSDLVYMPFLGFSALVFTLEGFIFGGCCDVFFSENVKLPMAFAAVGEFGYMMLWYLLILFRRGSGNLGSFLLGTILPRTVLTMLLTIPLYGVFYYFNRKISAHELEEKQSPWLRK